MKCFETAHATPSEVAISCMFCTAQETAAMSSHLHAKDGSAM